MTVCIAGVTGAYSDECAIVMAMDQMLTAGMLTSDMPDVAKGMRVHSRWFTMFAADDMEYVSPIISDVTRALAEEGIKPTLRTVVDTFVRTYQAQRLRIAEQTVLAPLNLTIENFTAMIATDDNEIIRALVRRMNDVEFSIEFLVCGFDDTPAARIFTIRPPGIEGHHDDVGFWSIGSGSESAINNLMARGYSMSSELHDAVYQVAESKFVAESALSVGSRTAIAILRVDEQMAFLTRSNADNIKEIWQREARPKMPEKLQERIAPRIRFRAAPPMSDRPISFSPSASPSTSASPSPSPSPSASPGDDESDFDV